MARPPRPSRGGYRGSFRRGLDLLERLAPEGKPLSLACDGRKQLLEAHAVHRARKRVLLDVHPNPPRGPKGSPRSREAMLRDRAMFPVDQLHALLRHSRADHRRETIAFGRRLNAVMERLFVAVTWKNFIKGRSERRPDRVTPAMHLGLTLAPWTWRQALSKRLFWTRVRLPPAWRDLYQRTWITPVLPTNSRHDCRHAA